MTDNKPTPLEAYKFCTPQIVRWGDMDAMQHVNNSKYFYYLESARIDFFKTLNPDFDKLSVESSIGFALAEVSCRFKAPVTFPDTLIIATAIETIEDTQFIVKQLLYSEKLQFITTESHSRVVYMDYKQGRRKRLNEQIIARLQEFSLSQ